MADSLPLNNEMSERNIVILGSTGSIGKSTLEVIDDNPGCFHVRALAAFSNFELLVKQYKKYRPEYLCLVDRQAGQTLQGMLKGESVKILIGQEAMVQLAGLDSVDIVLNAVVGSAGLLASLEAIKHGRKLALANKESLVAGGPLFDNICNQNEGTILPVDSEHSAIWQALRCGDRSEVSKILLTASGGPFRSLPVDQFEKITVEQALKHPTWKMGTKITIDSATLANKGLEVLEAVGLFGLTPDQIEVVVHPQSVIHSMVEYRDSSVIAQLSQPDMKLPIVYALFWPERVESSFGRIEWSELKQLTFEPPDYQKFPALKLAFEVAAAGGTTPAVYNAANEVAVEAFLNRAIGFTDIADTIKRTVESIDNIEKPQLEDILEADRNARGVARQMMEKTKC